MSIIKTRKNSVLELIYDGLLLWCGVCKSSDLNIIKHSKDLSNMSDILENNLSIYLSLRGSLKITFNYIVPSHKVTFCSKKTVLKDLEGLRKRSSKINTPFGKPSK